MLTVSDFQKLHDIPIEDVAEALNMNVRKHKCLCPWHDDSIASLTFHRAKNRFRCFVCNESGDSIKLVQEMNNLSFRDACHWLAQTFGILLDDECNRTFNVQTRKLQPAKKQPLDQPIDTRWLSLLVETPVLTPEAMRFLFDERKIRPEVVEQLGISSISSPTPMSGHPLGGMFNAPSLLFPYKDIEGTVLSVQARYLGDNVYGRKTNVDCKTSIDNRQSSIDTPKPRFQFPKGSTCHIFNLPVLKTLVEGEELWITEGVSDCLAMLSAGRKAIAIPSATLLKSEDVEAIAPYLKGIHLCCSPDDDEPGQALFMQLRTHFPNINHKMLPVGFKDYGEYWKSVKCQASSEIKLLNH